MYIVVVCVIVYIVCVLGEQRIIQLVVDADDVVDDVVDDDVEVDVAWWMLHGGCCMVVLLLDGKME